MADEALQPRPQFIIEYDPATGTMRTKFTGAMPPALLVNALAVAQQRIIMDQLRQMQVEQQQNEAIQRVIQANAKGMPRFPT